MSVTVVDWKAAAESLTPREQQVLDLWLHEYGLRRTADALGITISSVRVYRRSIATKLGRTYASQLPDLT